MVFETPASSLMDIYGTFTTGLAQMPSMAAEHASDDFRADLYLGQSYAMAGLDFPQFIEEVERQRAVISDLGRNIAPIEVIEGDNTLRVTYNMTVTFDGPLVLQDGEALEPTGEVFVIRVVDDVTFSEGKIMRFVTDNNLGAFLPQLFPAQ